MFFAQQTAMNQGMIDFKIITLVFRQFMVFLHVTSVLKMIAFGHVGAHPDVNKCSSM